MDFSVATVLATLALGLMVVLTGSVAYLTAADWRDRRRQQDLMRATRSASKKTGFK
ncbi:hypothetical protein [Prochlorothrix hollandica]|uniref:hypothetical protein n=1 Tax=Prochlorothrix hollandica TaxID=1223 RepID=UPI00034A0238|nr:hypothetical protein [Prochlorothrix hollandica]